MIELPSITLIAIAGNKHGETIAAIYKTLKQIKPAKTLFLTNIDITVIGDVETINVGGLETWEAYNYFCIKELDKYFDTTHCLLIQHDGYVLDAEQWDDEFLKYDYIGARWLDLGSKYNVGNGGFSTRSKSLQHILATDENIITTCPEDVAICKVYGQYLMDKYGIKFATEEIADKFSFELNQPLSKTFGFHGYHWGAFRETVVIKRSGAMGDVIMCEPVLEYFYNKGYQVAIDTQPDFFRVYIQHRFPVLHKSQLNPQLKYKEVNLDMGYEISPKKPVLQSYFDLAGIKDGILKNSKLNLYAGDNQRLFQKYVVIHENKTDMPYRNLHGLNWKPIVAYLKKKGYFIFQIGKDITNPIGIPFNTMTIEFMMFFIKGATLFIGSDSGPAQIAVGFDIPSVIFFGSVDSKLRYNNFDKIRVIQSECPKKETKHCYHSTVDVVGVDCVHNKELPPCTNYTSEQVMNAVKEFI